MCQLTFMHIPSDLKLTKILLSTQFLINSKSVHTDGWGIFQDKVFKSELNASLTSNLGELINFYIKNDKPIIAHVRAASTGTKVKKENSHPFETKSFILAHNGTVNWRKKETEEEWKKLCEENKDKNYEDMIDSEIFATWLQKVYDENKDKKFSEVIKMTADYFYGKFAFMIYAKEEDTFYIVRGSSATLFGCQVLKGKTPIGMIINTEDDDLDKAISIYKQSVDTLGKNSLDFSKIEALERETVYLYNPEKFEVEEIGDIDQHYSAITYTNTVSRTKHQNRNHNKNYMGYGMGPWDDYYDDEDDFNSSPKEKEEVIKEFIGKIGEFMTETDLSVRELERICHMIFGSSLLELAEEEYELLGNSVIAGLQLFYTPYKGTLWNNIRNEGLSYDFYKLEDSQFPYFLNEAEYLTKTFASLKEKKEEEKAKKAKNGSFGFIH